MKFISSFKDVGVGSILGEITLIRHRASGDLEVFVRWLLLTAMYYRDWRTWRKLDGVNDSVSLNDHLFGVLNPSLIARYRFFIRVVSSVYFVSCGLAINFTPDTLSCSILSSPSGIPARPSGNTSTRLGYHKVSITHHLLHPQAYLDLPTLHVACQLRVHTNTQLPLSMRIPENMEDLFVCLESFRRIGQWQHYDQCPSWCDDLNRLNFGGLKRNSIVHDLWWL